jgi:hypothetical protein
MSKTVHTDVREMRKAITRAGYGRQSVGGDETQGWERTSHQASMIRAVLTTAEHLGWSGEDAMAALAYHALVENERLYARLLEHLQISPAAPFLHTTPMTKEDLRP